MLRRPKESGLDWPGHRQGKGNKLTHPVEDFSTLCKNQRFRCPEPLSTLPVLIHLSLQDGFVQLFPTSNL